jgi:nondiscriminating aspartyl-tRNA synthetase
MTRVLTRDIAAKVGETATVQGWLHKKRLLGGLNFITLRDRSGIIQSLVDNKQELGKLRGMQIVTVLMLTGTVVDDERAHGGCGMGIDHIVQKTIGLSNIKEATLFPRDINRLTP